MANLPPFTLRDFRQGRFTNYSVSEELVPINSVNFTRNVNYDTVVGKAVVRPGTTRIGIAISSVTTPLGFASFLGKGGSPDYIYAVYNNATNGVPYYWNGTSWAAATMGTALSKTAINRFAVLGGSIFITNSTNGMQDAADHTFGTTNSISSGVVLPSLVHTYAATLLCAGDPTYPSRVWFSSVIDPAATPPFITWSTDPTTGDWIDIDPDDGGYLTAFAETSTFLLVFKNNAMYRLNAIAKSTDPQNIFNVGAVSQEAVTACQGIVYFFSGSGIYSTDGSFPQQQGRGQIQDIIDAIPQSSWASVAAGADEFNVYFSVGTITLNANTEKSVTITNCVIKYSTRDQNWSVHSYANLYNFFISFVDTNGRLLRGMSAGGQVDTLNLGTTDAWTTFPFSAAINFEMETQDIELADRSHLIKISNRMAVFTQNGQDSSILCKCDDEPKNIPGSLTKRVNIIHDIDLEGHYFRFKWYGTSSGKPPVFEGFTLETINDMGQTQS
jgi:hypothetical protein